MGILPLPTALFRGTGDSWREGQDYAIQRAIDSRKRWMILGLPVGVGKSLVGMTIARMTGSRALILTSTRGLQEQYAQTFGVHVHDIRGMRNYPCALLLDRGNRDTTCDLGPCHDGEECTYLAGGCAYFDALRDAAQADVVLTNYAMYYALQESGRVEMLGDRDLLICDEAHDAAAGLGGFAGAHFGPKDIRFPLGASDLDLPGWREWASAERRLAQDINPKRLQPRQRKAFRRLVRELDKLADAPGDWVADYRHKDGWAFEPIWARAYTDTYLWRDFAKVVLLSATLRPQSAEEELGLTEGDYEYYEAPSPFPPARRPIIHVRTVRVNHRMSEWAREQWVKRVDEILARRRDRKTVIHTVSFDRARELASRSRFGIEMQVARPGSGASELLRRYRGSPVGAILVSPSVHTGHDFPDDHARCQIIVKVPFPDTRYGLAAARNAEDRDYAARTAITTLIQMCGRAVRGPSDWAENFIIDDNVSHLLANHASLFPRWWRESYRTVDDVPAPMEME